MTFLALHFVLLLTLDPHETYCPDWAPIESHTDRGTFCSAEMPTEATFALIEAE